MIDLEKHIFLDDAYWQTKLVGNDEDVCSY